MDDDNTKTAKKIKQRKAPKRLSERYLKNAGEYYLNRFPASSTHFVRVMTRKIRRSCREYPEQDAQEWITVLNTIVVPYFEKLGFLNDDLYAGGLFTSLKRRGLSRTEIIRRMTMKGVDRDCIHALVTDCADGVNDKNAVIDFARKKKIGRFRPIPTNDPKERNRDLGKLARAGFSYDTAISVFDANAGDKDY